tara:strand:+ start:707 stop:1081 length:375 start_codon:yes stop_codon:yes gene_type:complete
MRVKSPYTNINNNANTTYRGVIVKDKDIRTKLNAKKILYIEDEIIQSLNSDISKMLIKNAYNKYKSQKIHERKLYYAIKRQVVQGCSDFSSMQEVLDFFDKKEYNTINKIGDKNENQIRNSNPR